MIKENKTKMENDEVAEFTEAIEQEDEDEFEEEEECSIKEALGI